MSYEVQQEDLTILRQKNKTLYVKIELLNKLFKVIDELQGELLEDNFSVNAESDIRRTCSLSFVAKNKSYLIGEDKKIWFDKYIRIYMGDLYNRDKTIHYYPFGTYTFQNSEYSFDPTTSTLSLSCVDLMGELNGIRNGQLAALVTKIPEGTDIRSSMVSTVTQLGGVKKYQIADVGQKVPYDLEFDVGSTVYDILKELANLYAGYEMFFDDDTFIFQPIPTCDEDDIFLDSDTLSPLVLSETTSNSFSEVKNITSVFGKCIDSDYYTETVTNTGAQYNLTIESIVLSDGKIPTYTQIGFKANSTNIANATIKVNSLTAYPIVDSSEKAITAGQIISGKSYVVKFSNNKFILQGQYQIHAINKLYSVMPSVSDIAQDKIDESCDNISYTIIADSPYCIDKIGAIRQTLSGDDYEKIYTDDLALQRAEYENWKSTRMTDSVSIEMITVPWLDVNKKISYASNLTGETNDYIVKSIDGSMMDGTMSVGMIKFYPLYPTA